MEVIYLIYFFSGILKSFLIYFGVNFPIDFTLFSIVLLLCAIVFDIYTNGIKKHVSKRLFYPIIYLLIFYFWIMFSLLYTKSPSYSYTKTFYFLTNLIAFIYPIIIKNFNIKKFLQLLSIVSVIFSLYFVSIFESLNSANEKDLEFIGLYLSLATILGISTLALLTSKNEKVFKNKSLNIILAGVSFFLILLFGARGPLFFVIVAYLIYSFFEFLKKGFVIKKKFIIPLVISFVIVLILTSIVLSFYKEKIVVLIEKSFYRIEILFNKDDISMNNESVNTRLDFYNFSINKILDNSNVFVIGYGIGSFNLVYEDVDGRGYPHNILLEVWFELGIIGLILFLIFLSIMYLKKTSNNFINHYILIYILLNMLKSSSLIDMRIYFAFFALFLIINKSTNLK